MKITNPDINQETSNGSKRYVPIIICGILLILCIAISRNSSTNITNMEETIKRQNDNIIALNAKVSDIESDTIETEFNEVEVIESEQREVSEEVSLSGLSMVRVAKDDEIAAEFLKKLLTWSNYADYENARNMMISDYGIHKKHALLTVFMPKVTEVMFGGSNMKYKKLSSYVTDITDETYTYFTLVDVSSKDVKNNMGSGVVGVTYTTNMEGTLSNISAYTISR